MNDCDLLDGGIELGCENNIGGVKIIAFTEKPNVSGLTLGSPIEEISAFTMAGSPAAQFYKFEFNKNTSSYTESEEHSQEAGRSLVTQTISLVLNRREKSKRDKLILLGKRKDLVALVKDANDQWLYFGEVNGLNMTTNEGGSGVAKTDPNQYVVTFVGEEPKMANFVQESAALAVIA